MYQKIIEVKVTVSLLKQSGVHWTCNVLLFSDFVNYGVWSVTLNGHA